MTREVKPKRPLSDRDLALLRRRGVLTIEETAFWIDGDLIAENVFSKSQRNLDQGQNLQLETKQRVLKG